MTSLSALPSPVYSHSSPAELDGLSGESATEAESKAYYDSLNQRDSDDEEAEYDTAAGLVAAYGASPPSGKRQKGATTRARAEVDDERKEADDEQQTRDRLAELQTPTGGQPAATAAAAEERPSPTSPQSQLFAFVVGNSNEQSAAGMAIERAIAATNATKRKVVPRHDEQPAEAASSVGKRVKSSLLATTSSGRQSRQAAGRGSKRASKHIEKKAAEEGSEEDGTQHDERKERLDAEEQPASAATNGRDETERPMTAADATDPFAFSAGRAADKGERNQQQQTAPAKRGRKAKTAANGPRKGRKQSAAGKGRATQRAAAEEQKAQPADNAAAAGGEDDGQVRRRTRHSAPRTAQRPATPFSTADVNAATAVAQPDEASHILSFPPATDDEEKGKQRSAVKKAAAGKKKGRGHQQPLEEEDRPTAAAVHEAVVDDMVDGGDVATALARVEATHLDGYSASPPSASWHKKKSTTQRQSEQKAVADERRMENTNGQPHTDATEEGAERSEDEQKRRWQPAKDDADKPPVVVKRKRNEERPLLAKNKKGIAVGRKVQRGSKRKQAEDVEEEQQQEQPADEEEQTEETDLYEFSSGGTEEQTKTTTRKKRATATNKRRQPAANNRATKASKKTDTPARSKRQRGTDTEAKLIDMFDAAARDIGLLRDSDDDGSPRAPAADTSLTDYDAEDGLAEPVVVSRPAKKRRAARPRTRTAAVATVVGEVRTTDHDVGLAPIVSHIAAYYQQVNHDVQDVAARADAGFERHVGTVNAIIAKLARSTHARSTALTVLCIAFVHS